MQGETAYLVSQMPDQGLGRVGGHALEWPEGCDYDAELRRRLRQGREGRRSPFSAPAVAETAVSEACGCIAGGGISRRGGTRGGVPGGVGCEEGGKAVVDGR
jgi:hypothetical protein